MGENKGLGSWKGVSILLILSRLSREESEWNLEPGLLRLCGK
jgi:hypothetical protein